MSQSLKQAVEEALRAYSPLRTSKAEISVAVEDGRVTLSGYVSAESLKAMAALLAGSVVGVTEVVNDLTADPKLERAVATALAADSRTRSLPIRARSDLGRVVLQGSVTDKADVEAALDVTRRVEGPRQIVNALHVAQAVSLAA
jgi:osmotically-inducible protein OsmY